MFRKKLPNRRRHEAINFRHHDIDYTAGIGFFEDGSPAEFFLNAHKSGSSADVSARDSAIAASLALQHSCPLERLYHALTRNPDGSAQGPLGRAIELYMENRNR
jgi:hypothetical protein